MLGRERRRQYFGKEPDTIIQPYSKSEINWLFQTTDQWPIACASFSGQLDNHYPANKLLQFFRIHWFVFPKNTSLEPLPGASTIFTDGSSSGKAAFTVSNQTNTIQTTYTSAQLVELFAVLTVLQTFSDKPINLYTDSAILLITQILLILFPF